MNTTSNSTTTNSSRTRYEHDSSPFTAFMLVFIILGTVGGACGKSDRQDSTHGDVLDFNPSISPGLPFFYRLGRDPGPRDANEDEYPDLTTNLLQEASLP